LIFFQTDLFFDFSDYKNIDNICSKDYLMSQKDRIVTQKFLAWCDCAQLSKQIGNYQLAIEYYDRALQLVPNNHNIWQEQNRLISLLNARILAENQTFQLLQRL